MVRDRLIINYCDLAKRCIDLTGDWFEFAIFQSDEVLFQEELDYCIVAPYFPIFHDAVYHRMEISYKRKVVIKGNKLNRHYIDGECPLYSITKCASLYTCENVHYTYEKNVT